MDLVDMVSKALSTPEAIRAVAKKMPKKALVYMLSHAVADKVVHGGDSFGRPAPWLVCILREGFKGYSHMNIRQLADVAADTFNTTEAFTDSYGQFLNSTKRSAPQDDQVRDMEWRNQGQERQLGSH